MLKENGEQLLKNYTEVAYPPTITEVSKGIYHVLGDAHNNSIVIEAERLRFKDSKKAILIT
jgi:hypothetical protein